VGGDGEDANPVLGDEVVEPVHRRGEPSPPVLDVADPDAIHGAGQTADEVPPVLTAGPGEGGPQVVLLAADYTVGVEVRELGWYRLRPGEEVVAVMVADVVLLAGLGEPHLGVGPHGLEHAIPPVRAVVIGDDQ
jgi:hypothetical protein